MATITLTGADDGKTVDLGAGDDLVLRLKENPTTGYQWALEPGSDAVLAPQASDYVGGAGPALGGGGERVFTFKAQQAGSATIRLKLWRAWEGDKSVTERFAATVRVHQ